MDADPLSKRLPPESRESSGLLLLIRGRKSGISALHHRHAKYSGIAVFCLGFFWDSLTLTRIDNLIDNIFLLFYLILIGVMITFTLRRQGGAIPANWIQKLEPHFPWVMQFCFGGLFSSYVVFYFKSASWTRTQVFFLVLVFLLIANEFLQNSLQKPRLLAILYSFCLFSFLAFFLPVVFATLDERIFLLAGLLSLVISLFVFSMGLSVPHDGWKRRMAPIAAWIGAIVLAVNILYFANLIPPVPLALKSAGIYHKAFKTPAGYVVQYVSPPPWRFWIKFDSPFYLSPGERIYCYTAIFAPGKLQDVPICHVWSHKTPGGWVQTDRIGFDISAGRAGGYRGYTFKHGITPGIWRVEVETIRGQILGKINFDVVTSPVPHPPLQARLIR